MTPDDCHALETTLDELRKLGKPTLGLLATRLTQSAGLVAQVDGFDSPIAVGVLMLARVAAVLEHEDELG